MKAFAVKHIVVDAGPFSKVLAAAKKQPYSLTSKKDKAEEAAKDNFVYVIEVLREAGHTIYRLGYKFRSSAAHERAGGALWDGRFKYKNTVEHRKSSDGIYLDSPVEITHSDFHDWFRGETLGMTEIPKDLVDVLESILSDPSNHAQHFTV